MSSTILFYNKSAFPNIWQNTPFTTLFKTFMYLLSWAWFYLSSKWFLNKNRPSFKFYSICFAIIFLLNIFASSSSLLTLSVVIPLICIFYRLLILRHWDIDQVRHIANTYSICGVVFCLILWCGVAMIYHHTGSLEYSEINKFLSFNINKCEN